MNSQQCQFGNALGKLGSRATGCAGSCANEAQQKSLCRQMFGPHSQNHPWPLCPDVLGLRSAPHLCAERQESPAHPSPSLAGQAQLAPSNTHCSLPSPGLCSCPAPAHSGLGAGRPAQAEEEEEGSAWHEVCAGRPSCAWGSAWESVCMAASSWCGQPGCVP